MSARVAAFFDLDGTVMPWPSLERRFFRILRRRREIPLKNYFLWLKESLKRLPRGIPALAQSNKMYLRAVRSFDERAAENRGDRPVHNSGHPWQSGASQVEGQASGPPRRNPRWPVLCFFEQGVERVTCHAMLGHTIVIVSGTLQLLANAAARALEAEIAARGFTTKIRVCATELEEINGKWTGQILGDPMFREAKARVVCALAEEMNLDLSQCWAYGDSAKDRWMLAAVGNPVAVNPAPRLARIARKRGWRIWRTTDRLQKLRNLIPQAEQCA